MSLSAELFQRAQHTIPGGVNSPVRAFKSVGGTPVFIDRADGAYIYDVDGMEGLYVPSSAFREMTRSMGENIVQGQNLSSGSADFFTTTLSSVYQSTSKTISDVIRKNKAKIKYNSFVYLIDNKELEKKKKNIYKKNTNP